LTHATNPSQLCRPTRNKALVLLALGYLLGGGCGLGDYEAQMRKEQARLDFIDRENDNLGDPPGIDRPKTTEKDKSPIPPGTVTLRQPQEISKTCSDDRLGIFFDYPRKGGTKGKIKHLYLAWEEKAKAKDFREKVCAALDARGIRVSPKSLTQVKLKERPPGRKRPPSFEYTSYDTKEVDANKNVKETRYFVYFYPDISTEEKAPPEAFQVAIIFAVEMDPAKDTEEPAEQRVGQATRTEIDFSLGTLLVGSSPSQAAAAPATKGQ
jgi:hypothetical protein